LPSFRRLWDIPGEQVELEKNALYRNMSDIELVLRFFALSHYEEMDMKFKDFLSDFLDTRNKEYVTNPAIEHQDREVFVRAVENCWIVWGAAAFRKDLHSKKSAPLADAVMVPLSKHPAEVVKAKSANIRAAIQQLLDNNDDFKKAFGTGTNGKGAIRKRIELAQSAVEAAVSR
jgi:hypothetical protein